MSTTTYVFGPDSIHLLLSVALSSWIKHQGHDFAHSSPTDTEVNFVNYASGMLEFFTGRCLNKH